MPHYFITPPAARDMEEIEEYISRDNPAAAGEIIRVMTQKFKLLAERPGLHPPRPYLGNLRKSSVDNYLIFYRAVKNGIQIMRVLHGTRDLQKTFKSYH